MGGKRERKRERLVCKAWPRANRPRERMCLPSHQPLTWSGPPVLYLVFTPCHLFSRCPPTPSLTGPQFPQSHSPSSPVQMPLGSPSRALYSPFCGPQPPPLCVFVLAFGSGFGSGSVQGPGSPESYWSLWKSCCQQWNRCWCPGTGTGSSVGCKGSRPLLQQKREG